MTTEMPKKVSYEEHLEQILIGCPIPADVDTIKLFKGKQLFAYQRLALAKRDMEQFKICVDEIQTRLDLFDGLMERTALHFGGNV